MPTPMERAPEPDLTYAPIPKDRYTSAEFAALVVEHGSGDGHYFYMFPIWVLADVTHGLHAVHDGHADVE